MLDGSVGDIVRFDANGYPVHFHTTGTDYLKNPVDEQFDPARHEAVSTEPAVAEGRSTLLATTPTGRPCRRKPCS